MKELKEPFSVADICRFSIVARNACIEFQKNEDTDNKSNDMMSDIKEYAHNLDKTLQLYYDEPEKMCDEGVLKKEQEAFNRFSNNRDRTQLDATKLSEGRETAICV